MLPSSIEELNCIKDEAKSMVTKRASISATAAAVPLPGVDIGTDVAIMLELLPAINRKFGLTPEQIDQLDTQTKQQLFVIITSLGAELAGKFITKELVISLLKKAGARAAIKSTTKFLPLVGTAISAGISFGAMKYLGNSHVEECYNVCRRMLDNKQ